MTLLPMSPDLLLLGELHIYLLCPLTKLVQEAVGTFSERVSLMVQSDILAVA